MVCIELLYSEHSDTNINSDYNIRIFIANIYFRALSYGIFNGHCCCELYNDTNEEIMEPTSSVGVSATTLDETANIEIHVIGCQLEIHDDEEMARVIKSLFDPFVSNNKSQKKISNININNISLQSYSSLKCIIMTNSNNYNITKTKMYKSFSDDKNVYFIDMILLLELGDNNWIGIIFRNYTKNNNYIHIECQLNDTDICTSDVNSGRDRVRSLLRFTWSIFNETDQNNSGTMYTNVLTFYIFYYI